MSRMFVSYSREDQGLVRRLVGWLIIFRRSLRHIVIIIAATTVLFYLGGVFFANGDGIDGYGDDKWEYLGGLLTAASWWWPFALPSYRARLPS